MESLKRATTIKKINNKSSKLQVNVKDLESLLGKFNEKDDIEDFTRLLLKDPKGSSKILQAKNKDVYAVEQSGHNWVRSSKIVASNAGFVMSTLESRIPTPNAIQIPVGSLLSALSGQVIVYLDLEAKKRPLGRVRILLTCGPKRRAQMLSLCAGQGNNTFRGSWFDKAGQVGESGELIFCYGYISASGLKVNIPTLQDMEQDQCKKLAEGAVTGWPSDAKFCICTTDNPSSSDTMPEIGRVVSGLDMLRQAIRQYSVPENTKALRPSYNAEHINIVEAGIEINEK